MTTRPTPPRTMLPPNLTRHLYETQRRILLEAGMETKAWHQLTAAEAAAVEQEVETFRQAIRAAEEEQGLIASLDATRAAAGDTPAAEEAAQPPQDAAGETAGEECPCLGCTAVALLQQLLPAAQRLEAALGWDGDSSGQGATVFGFRTRPLSDKERAELEQAARDAINDWIAKGSPLREVTIDPATLAPRVSFDSPWLTVTDLERSLALEAQRVRWERRLFDVFRRPPTV